MRSLRKPRPAPARKTGPSITELRDWVGLALGNAAVFTSLLVYFGWRRNEAHAAALGLRESLTEQAPSEYVLKSVGPVIVMVIASLVIGYAGLGGLRLLRRIRTRGKPRMFRRVSLGVTLLGGLLPVLVTAMGITTRSLDVIAIGFPLSIGLGALIVWFAWRERRSPSDGPASLQSRILISALTLVTLFWTVDRYAEWEGRRLGRSLESELPSRTAVVAYSPDRLYIDAPGVHEDPLASADGKYRYRYRGLRLLDRTGQRYFLVSDCWTSAYGVVLILPVEADLRYEFVHDSRNEPTAKCHPRE
jgi:hypothetical protein